MTERLRLEIEKARTLFEAALDLPDDQRSQFLDEACGADSSMRDWLDRLLSADASPIPFPDLSELVTDLETLSPPRETIDDYTIVDRIASGGMGIVYRAEQQRPVRRTVAIKVLYGIETDETLARFEMERQALALMEHPHIARVFDAGTTRDGRPYFVMEHVAGAPITTWCDEQQLGVRERLELFVQVCHAVEHAHRRGIIHRDLKPSNVLVTEHEGVAIPKVIDFGIAKVTQNADVTDAYQTRTWRAPGTPTYMSPEQTKPDARDIDTRTDVYSLGTLLYRLLTGVTPLDDRLLRDAAVDEVFRAIRSIEPKRPSQRVRALEEQSAPITAARRTSVDTLARRLRCDLDAIVMTALAKDRDLRYGSSRELAEDVMRHLRNEPVAARPPSLAYRVRKLTRRHRTAVVLGTLLVISLVAGIVFTTAALLERTHQVEVANEATLTREIVLELLAEVLSSADPVEGGRQDVTVADAIKTLPQVLDRRADLPSGAGAYVRRIVGIVSHGLGDYVMAEELLREALRIETDELGYGSDRTFDLERALGVSLFEQEKFDEASQRLRRSLESASALLGPESAEALKSLDFLARCYQKQGDAEGCEKIWRRIAAIKERTLGPRHEETTLVKHNLAHALYESKRYDEAIDLGEIVLAIRIETLGEIDHETLLTLQSLSAAHWMKARSLATTLSDEEWNRRLDHAVEFGRRAVAGREKFNGADAIETCSSRQLLAQILMDRGHVEESVETARVSYEILVDKPPLFDEARLQSQYIYGGMLYRAGRYLEAEPHIRSVLEAREAEIERYPNEVGRLRVLYALILDELGRHEEAAAIRAKPDP